MDYIENGSDWLSEMVAIYGMKLIAAIITLVIGLWIIKIITGVLYRVMTKRELEVSLRDFLKTLAAVLLKVMLFITVIGMMGIQMTSFIAILAAAGLAVGLALSGTLQNLAGGVMILIFKPFKAGDFIEAQGYTGIVSDIQIFITVLKTPDNKTVIIPNGGLATGALINYSVEANRRVDFSFGIAYGDDYDHAKKVISQLIEADTRILHDPAPFIALGELADSSVNITVRVWAKASDYWGVHFDLNEKIYKTFPSEKLNIPFPQIDVHLQK